MSDNSPLSFWCYAKRNDAAQIEHLLSDALVPVDDVNDFGETALHLAASRGHDDAVRVLLQHNANLLAKDWESGWTPLHRSVYHDRLSTTLLLLRHARVHFGKKFMHAYLHDVRDVAHQSALELLSSHLADVFATECTNAALYGDDDGAVPQERSGTVYTFGKADFQLGYHLPNADVQTFPRPVELPTTASVVQISASKYHTIALTATGACYVWGFGKGGRLGTGTEFDHVEPTRIASLEQIPIAKVAAGENHTLALSRSGQVFSWGANSFGQLGHSVKTCSHAARMTPKRIDAFRGRVVTDIAVSGCHSAAICCSDDDGGASSRAVFTWGNNKKGQLGRKDGVGTDQAFPSPKCVDALVADHPLSVIYEAYDRVTAVQVALSDAHTSVVLACTRNGQTHGQVWTFGYGSTYPTRMNFHDKRRTASNLMTNAWTPSWQQRTSDIVALACAQHHSIALSSCGAVYTWGHNGQALSHHKQQSPKAPVVPGAPQKVALAKFGRVASISASHNHCAVVTVDGNLITWGCGSQNVLGHGQGNTWQPNPKRVPGVKKAIAVATGHQHTAVLIAPYEPPAVAASSSSSGVVPSLLELLQHRIAPYVDLANCVTLWKYASALATPHLERHTRAFMRLNWDAVLEIVGRERIELLFELLLPPLASTTTARTLKPPVALATATTSVPPSPVLTALRDFAHDKRAEKRSKSGAVATTKRDDKPPIAAVATMAVEPATAHKTSALMPSAARELTTVRSSSSGALDGAAVAKTARRKAAKFVPLDQFFAEPKTKTSLSQQQERSNAAPSKTEAVPRSFLSPWTASASAAPLLPLQRQDEHDGFSIGRAKSMRKASGDHVTAAPTLSSLPKPRMGDVAASPSLASASPALLAQDGSERQLLSTFSLDAFIKKPSRNGRKKTGGAAATLDDNDAKAAASSWLAGLVPAVRVAPAKTLKEIQQEEEARAAAEAAAKARNGGFARRTSTVNSWGLCEAQRHISLAEVQQLQLDQEMIEQQHQILAQIERERRRGAAHKNNSAVAGASKTASAKASGNAPATTKKDKRAGTEDAVAVRRASKASKKQQQATEALDAASAPTATHVAPGKTTKKTKKTKKKKQEDDTKAPRAELATPRSASQEVQDAPEGTSARTASGKLTKPKKSKARAGVDSAALSAPPVETPQPADSAKSSKRRGPRAPREETTGAAAPTSERLGHADALRPDQSRGVRSTTTVRAA